MASTGACPATRPDAPLPSHLPGRFGWAYAPLCPTTEFHGMEGVMVYDIARIYTVHEEEVC